MPFSLPDSTADTRQEMIADYLDHLCGPLLGTVPLREREAIRAEVEDHLYGMMDEYEAEGLCSEEATRAALRGYGEPWRIGQAFLETWCHYNTGSTKNAFSRYLPQGMSLVPFVIVGLGSATCHLLLQANLLLPKSSVALGASFTGVNLIVPIIAGSYAGSHLPAQPMRPILFAMSPILLHTLAIGFAMAPARELFTLLIVQLLYWLPISMLCAVATANIQRYRRRTTYLRRIGS